MGSGVLHRHFRAVCCCVCVLLLGASLLCLEDFRLSVKQVAVVVVGSGPEDSRGIAGFVTPPSAVRCNRIVLPDEFQNETQGPYNPAAVRHPVTGEWLVVYTYDECWYKICEYAKTGLDVEQRMRSHPLLLRLGAGPAPDMRLAASSVRVLDLDEASYNGMLDAFDERMYKAADWRPFAWRGEVYLGHWTAFRPIEERMSLSRLNLDDGTVHLVHRFDRLSPEVEASQRSYTVEKSRGLFRAPPARPTFQREKNWGFIEEDGMLMVYYALMPCTVVMRYDPALPDGMAPHARHCYEQQSASILQRTGMDMLRFEMHTSGNPVPWDCEEEGGAHSELFSMLHIRHTDYVHWGVRIDRATHRITHVSAGPLVKSTDFRNEGFIDTALVVSSFHVLHLGGSGAPPTLRILYGEGDRYGCWLDIDMAAIVWHELAAPPAWRPLFRSPLAQAPARI